MHFFRQLNFQKCSERVVLLTFWLSNCAFAPQRACTFFDISTSKSGPSIEHGVLCTILTSKCASRHSAVHFSDIATSTNPLVFFSHFDSGNVLRATKACTCSRQKWSEREVLLAFFTCKCASAPQRRAIFHLSSGQRAPHPPL